MEKRFKNNETYLNWYNKYHLKYKIISVKVCKVYIIVKYEKI